MSLFKVFMLYLIKYNYTNNSLNNKAADIIKKDHLLLKVNSIVEADNVIDKTERLFDKIIKVIGNLYKKPAIKNIYLLAGARSNYNKKGEEENV